MEQVPSAGRIVQYKLTQANASQVNRRRPRQRDDASVPIHAGNQAYEGDIYPMLIVRAWGNEPTSAVNGQVFLDGDDTLWVTSVTMGDDLGQFFWPVRT